MSDRPLFTTFNDDGSPVVAWLSQQLFVPPACLVLFMIISMIIPEIPWEYVHASVKWQLLEVARSMILSAVVGLALGTHILRAFPMARAAGKWIGVMPAILFIGALVSEAHTFTLSTALAEAFFPGPDGEGWWGFMLFTCPTISTLCYSAAMRWPLLQRQQSTTP